MRIWNPRYLKDLQRVNLAQRLLTFGARPQIVSDWTGLTIWQVRSLCKDFGYTDGAGSPSRRRGPSPKSLSHLLTSERWRSEASVLVSLCYVFEAMPTEPLRDLRRELPTLQRGERFCRAYEVYGELFSGRSLDVDEAMLVYTEAAAARAIRADRCESCSAVIIRDVGMNNRFRCLSCVRSDSEQNAPLRA